MKQSPRHGPMGNSSATPKNCHANPGENPMRRVSVECDATGCVCRAALAGQGDYRGSQSLQALNHTVLQGRK